MGARIANYHILGDVEAELNKARGAFPDPVDSLPALVEEVGELSQALLQHKHQPLKNITHRDIYNEAIQVAVMAIRVASEGDPNFTYEPVKGYKGGKP